MPKSGSDALAKLRETPTDVVLTDLRMPEMDGLDLMRAVRLQYADVPVVLMTAQGSEELAVEALEQGAASYVPKSHLAQMLVDVLQDVLGVVRADRSYERLIRCMARNEFSFTLGNDPTLIGPLVDLAQQICASLGLCDLNGRVRIAAAFEQALLNALFRGNLEIDADVPPADNLKLVEERRSQSPFAERNVYVDLAISGQEARFVVRDEGPGFDTSSLSSDSKPESLEGASGRGLVLMRTLMDEVTYNDRGNEVTLVKRGETDQEAAARKKAVVAELPKPTKWGEVPAGSRVIDSISGRTYRAHVNGDEIVLAAGAGEQSHIPPAS